MNSYTEFKENLKDQLNLVYKNTNRYLKELIDELDKKDKIIIQKDLEIKKLKENISFLERNCFDLNQKIESPKKTSLNASENVQNQINTKDSTKIILLGNIKDSDRNNVFDYVILIKKNQENCPFTHCRKKLEKNFIHMEKLEKRFVYLAVYPNKTKNKRKNKSNLIGYIRTQVLVCKICNVAFANIEVINNINSMLIDKKIKQVNIKDPIVFEYTLDKKFDKKNKLADKEVNKTITTINSNKLVDKNGISYYPTFGAKKDNTYKMTSNNHTDFEMNLNEESELKKLGYNTQLSNENRWNILKNKAIKERGLKRTIKHIEFLIKLNQNKKNFQRALSIWRHDLEKLKKLK